MSEKAIVPVTKEAWEVIQNIAPVAVASRMFGVTKEQAMIVMLTGHELGLPVTAAFDVIYVSKDGRRTLRPKGALALVHNSGLLEEFDWVSDSQKATVTMKRKGGKAHSMTLTIEQAKQAGWKSTAWETTPANLLRWRLVGWMTDLLFADVLCGLSIADDSYLPVEITEDGDVVETSSSWIVEPVTKSPPKSDGDNGKDEPVAASKASEAVEAKEEAPAAEKADREEALVIHTVADILAVGFDVTAIQEAVAALKADSQDVHFPPATSEECQMVMAKLQEVPSATD